jgi:NAD-dependent dihydropyrimidine dehydrogenase PreA subunit
LGKGSNLHFPTSTTRKGDGGMAFVITEPCIGVKDASCTDVCPVDCIHSTDEDKMYYIDPGECIDCAYCEAVCPVNAIFDEFTVPPNWRQYIQKNREYFKKR